MKKHFIFGIRGNVSSLARYDYDSPGAGFVTEKEWKEQQLQQIFELNSGFALPYWYKDENISVIESDEDGCFNNSHKQVEELWERDNGKQPGGQRNIPLYFKVSLPEQGNYTPLLKKPVRLSVVKDADSVDNSDSKDHQAEKDGSDGLTHLLEAVRQARQKDS